MTDEWHVVLYGSSGRRVKLTLGAYANPRVLLAELESHLGKPEAARRVLPAVLSHPAVLLLLAVSSVLLGMLSAVLGPVVAALVGGPLGLYFSRREGGPMERGRNKYAVTFAVSTLLLTCSALMLRGACGLTTLRMLALVGSMLGAYLVGFFGIRRIARGGWRKTDWKHTGSGKRNRAA